MRTVRNIFVNTIEPTDTREKKSKSDDFCEIQASHQQKKKENTHILREEKERTNAQNAFHQN